MYNEKKYTKQSRSNTLQLADRNIKLATITAFHFFKKATKKIQI